jgi:hypothetical protein
MSNFLKVLAFVIYAVCGVWRMILSVPIIYQIGGVILVILGFFIFPITLLIAPWYEVIVNHHWFLFLLTYGPWPLGGALFAISEILEKRSAKH